MSAPFGAVILSEGMNLFKALRYACLASAFTVLPAVTAGIHGFSAPQAQAAELSANSVGAAQAALRGDFNSARVLAEKSGDQSAIKLVEFLYLKDHWKDAGHNRLVKFLKEAPKWPLSETMRKQAEHQLYADNHSASEIEDYFGNSEPMSAEGELAMARLKFAKGDVEAGKRYLKRAWLSSDVDSVAERQILEEFGNALGDSDRRKRVWALVMNQESNAAIRNAKRLGGDIVSAAETAQLLLRFVGGADKKYSALPASMREQAAMKYALARFYRKNERFEKARDVLVSMSSSSGAAIMPEAVWVERRIIARRFVGPFNRDTYRSAYQIASKHGLESGEEALEAHFLSGWIALRYLKDADAARGHFEKLSSLAKTRTDKARALYWIGRSNKASGKDKAAADAFEKASQYSTIYYGQLAREENGLGSVAQKINGGTASAEAAARVERDEVVRAFRLSARAGGKGQLNLFLHSLASRFDSADELNAIASMVHDHGGTPAAVRFAKAAAKRGVDIDAWAYPVKALPSWSQVGRPVEKSLVYALSRQESEFDTNAGSLAGAQGLMQLMPGTARLVANQYKLPFAPQKLKSDPAYNVKLGSAHLSDLIADYNGSYILTLVAYNAGPRRVKEWVAEFGDPRSGKVDPIDWVESIPFQETRQYVQKVMQNVHVYRSRLAPSTVAPMSADLRRGSPAKITELMTGSVSPVE